MYSLLPDETGCKSVLGTLLYCERKNFGFAAKVVDVELPSSRLFGHVEYKLEISAIPHNSIDHEPRMFNMATRYKELNNLHSTLSTIHRQLYLKGKFPPFAEPKFFNATDPQTLSERRASIETFLQFALNNEVLGKSVKFQQFLENSHEQQKAEDTKPKELEVEGEKDSNQQQKDDVIAEEVSENAKDDKGGPNE